MSSVSDSECSESTWRDSEEEESDDNGDLRLFQELELISIPDDIGDFGVGDVLLDISVRDEMSETMGEVPGSPIGGNELPETEGEKWKYVQRLNEKAHRLFGSYRPFKGSSALIVKGIDMEFLKKVVDFGSGYKHRLPKLGDKIWEMPEYGCIGVPMIYFEFGMRLPMHPFFLHVYEAIGCGFGQLSPNAVVQIAGVIARCAERRIAPSLSLLFSIYGAKYCGGQFYLDKKRGGVRVVEAPSSNHTWHPRFTFLNGVDLSLVGPWRDVNPLKIQILNELPKMPKEDVKEFCGLYPSFDYKQFKEIEFLECHNLAGEVLSEIIQSGNMISDKTLALLSKRAAEVAASAKKGEAATPGSVKEIRGSEVPSLVVRSGQEGLPSKNTRVEDETSKDRRRHRSDKDKEKDKESHHVKRHRSDPPKGLTKEDDIVVSDEVPSTDTPRVPLPPSNGVIVRFGEKDSWAIGKSYPLQIFDGFVLPRDNESYRNLSREDVGMRSLRRFGRFAADFCRILADFRADHDPRLRERINKEVAELRGRVMSAESKAVEAVSREKGAEEKMARLEKSWGEEKQGLQKSIIELEAELGKMRLDGVKIKKELDDSLASVSRIRQESEGAAKTILSLKGELEQSELEAAMNVEEGYKVCLERLGRAGIDCSGHEFEVYAAGIIVVPRD